MISYLICDPSWVVIIGHSFCTVLHMHNFSPITSLYVV